MWEVKWLESLIAKSRYELLDESYKGNVNVQYDKVPSNN